VSEGEWIWCLLVGGSAVDATMQYNNSRSCCCFGCLFNQRSLLETLQVTSVLPKVNVCCTSQMPLSLPTFAKSKVNLDICKAPLNTKAFSKVLRYVNTQFYLQICYTCLYSPATEHHCPLAGTHFTVPQRVEGWVAGFTYRNKVPLPGVEPGHGHSSQY